LETRFELAEWSALFHEVDILGRNVSTVSASSRAMTTIVDPTVRRALEKPDQTDSNGKDSSDPMGPGVAAVIVAFQPVAAQLNRLIGVLARDCRIVYVMDNGGGRDAVADTPRTHDTVRVVEMGGNEGIGQALTLGFQLAKAAGVKYVTTFDQDSEPQLGQTTRLVSAMERLISSGARVAAVGPRIVDVRNERQFEYPFMRRTSGWPTAVKCASGSEYVETDCLITSGCLIALAAYEVVGGFDSRLFVDYTDTEWCFRARASGYRLYGICAVTMCHELGTGVSSNILGMTVLGHSPIRRYYYARNTVRLLKLWHVTLGWKGRMLGGLIARVLLLPAATKFNTGWTQEWLMLARGIVDGIVGVGGAYRNKQ
jgi:rhamnosyltransferase